MAVVAAHVPIGAAAEIGKRVHVDIGARIGAMAEIDEGVTVDPGSMVDSMARVSVAPSSGSVAVW